MSSPTDSRQRHADRYTGLIIHLFAAAHAATAVITRLLDYYDEIPLTLLTISMLILIAQRRDLSPTYTAVITLVVTLLGYLLGVWCGQQLDLLVGSPYVASALTTFVLTELFGWGTYLFTAKSKSAKNDRHLHAYVEARQILAAALIILSVRITYSLIYRSPYFIAHGGIYVQFGELFSNTFAVLTLLCFVAISASVAEWKKPFGYPLLIMLMLLFPLVPAVIAYYDLPQFSPRASEVFDRFAFAGLYSVALLTAVITYPAALLIKFAIASRRTIYSERSKKLSEQYKYAKLKQQISPHFLFNSLNILDSLVQSGENERAGRYIRQLAALYRYILKNEEEQLVTLGEELEFTDMYIELLKVRFADGFVTESRIPSEARNRHIVPCGLQMLIENAIKHNAVSTESPLRVTVSVEGDFISVSNNIRPRISTQPSTRLSLKNLSRQYENIAGAGIEVLHTQTEFKVRLPLL